eukprot:TRINITY_DN5793_c0_g1_i1.p1 TRINITY_DN5793_c0_g1~~TRINITY_DN5793_c0_g1_i1.p1  ORF type:complete len:163 (+),score=19.72 TRINITY_DN5793_c0_g1_i1:49-489(+)
MATPLIIVTQGELQLQEPYMTRPRRKRAECFCSLDKGGNPLAGGGRGLTRDAVSCGRPTHSRRLFVEGAVQFARADVGAHGRASPPATDAENKGRLRRFVSHIRRTFNRKQAVSPPSIEDECMATWNKHIIAAFSKTSCDPPQCTI